MAIIKKQKVENPETVPIRMPESLALLLSQYAKAKNTDRHYVVTELLRHEIESDKEFMAAQQEKPSAREDFGKRAAKLAAKVAVAAE